MVPDESNDRDLLNILKEARHFRGFRWIFGSISPRALMKAR
jgi:hypothetical protein